MERQVKIKDFKAIKNIKNKDCIPYLEKLEDNQNLLITNDDGFAISFIKRNGIIYEYYNIFFTRNIEEYIDWECPISFFFMDISQFGSLSYTILDMDEWQKALKQNNLKNTLKQLSNDEENNAKLIAKDLQKDGGKFVSFGTLENDNGLLVCAVTSDEDYYWVYIDLDLKVRLSSCVGKYKVIETPGVEYNILDYLRTMDEESLYGKIMDKFKDGSDAIFTDVIINNYYKYSYDGKRLDNNEVERFIETFYENIRKRKEEKRKKNGNN